MGFINQTRVGNIGPFGDGTTVDQRGDRQGSTVVSELNGRYYENNFRGNVFYCANSAGQALSLSSTTTYTGLTVANPTASGKNLILLEAVYALSAGETTALGAIIIGTGAFAAQTTGASVGPLSCLLGSGASSVAKVGASCTYAANPSFLRPFMGFVWATAAGFAFGQYKDDIGGAIIVTPGQQVSFVAVTTATTGIGSFTWAELPI